MDISKNEVLTLTTQGFYVLFTRYLLQIALDVPVELTKVSS